MEHDNVAPVDFAVRHNVIPDPPSAITEFVHQQVVTDQQRVFHRFGRNLKGLHHEGDHKNSNDHRGQQGLHGTRPIGSGCLWLGLRRYFCYFTGWHWIDLYVHVSWPLPWVARLDIPTPGEQRPVPPFSW